MKTILCYGDSNTYGFNPKTGGRYTYDVRWPGVMQNCLGRDDYYVMEEGLNSRTTICNDPCYFDNKNGLALLPAILNSHLPLDLLIIMLGSNDMKLRFSMQAIDIATGASMLVQEAKHVFAQAGCNCEILLMAPPYITEDMKDTECYCEFGERALQISAELSERYAAIAKQNGVHFLDVASIVKPSSIDGLHLTPEGHTVLANHVAEKCREILNMDR